MKKRSLALAALLLSGVMAFTVACGNDTPAADTPATDTETPADDTEADEPEDTTEPVADGEVTDITIWTHQRHDQEFMQNAIAQINADNPDINVIFEVYSDNYQQALLTAATTGNLPDIVNSGPGIESLLERGDILGLDNLVSDDFRARFPDSLFLEGVNKFNGEITSFPAWSSATRMIYNRDILNRVGVTEAPSTLDEMVEVARKVTEELGSEGIFGFSLPLASATSALNRGFNALPGANGRPVNPDGYNFATGQFDFGAFSESLLALSQMWNDGSFFPGSEALNIDPLRTQFADGRIAMYFSFGFAEYGVYANQFPTDEDWGYAMLPTIDGSFAGQAVNVGRWWSITNNTVNADKAARVLEALYGLELMIDYYEAGLGIAVVPDVVEQAPVPAAIQTHPLMADLPTDHMFPPGPLGLVIEGNDWQTEFVHFILTGGGDVDALIEMVNERYNTALESAIANGVTHEIIFPNFDPANPVETSN